MQRRGLGPDGTLAAVIARPRTGRLHQVRAHIAAAGLRLVGEGRYLPEGESAGPPCGEETDLPELPRPALHAWRLELEHPLGGRVALEAPLPPDLAGLLGEAP
jgi:23S rRNA pseudouridine1911/1915/1917 synthase